MPPVKKCCAIDALPVREAGVFGGHAQRAFFGGSKVVGPLIETARVFSLRPEDQLKEPGRNFIVLGVGLSGIDRNRKRSGRAQEAASKRFSVCASLRRVRPTKLSMTAALILSGYGRASPSRVAASARVMFSFQPFLLAGRGRTRSSSSYIDERPRRVAPACAPRAAVCRKHGQYMQSGAENASSAPCERSTRFG